MTSPSKPSLCAGARLRARLDFRSRLAVLWALLVVGAPLAACSDDGGDNGDANSGVEADAGDASGTNNGTSNSSTNGGTTSTNNATVTDVGPDTDDPDAELDAADDADAELDVPEDVPEPVCEDGQTQCAGEARVETCVDGQWATPESCDEGWRCSEGVCEEPVCTPNEARCADEATLAVCDRSGFVEDTFACPEGTFCEDARCAPLCEPGELVCVGESIQACQDDGVTLVEVDRCSLNEGFVCSEGACVSGCDAFQDKQYIGCDFWGVDTPNQFGIINQFAFVVSNVDDEREAMVRVETSQGELLVEETVAPQDVATLRLDGRPQNNPTTGIRDTGFRIISDVPVTAYQFNPLQRFDNELMLSVASNDASLLFPDSALGQEYLAVAFEHWGGGTGYASFLTVVSTADDNTLTITPTAQINGGEGVPPMAPGEATQITLNQGQVLTLTTNANGDDLTGTEILSEAPIAVHGGVDCAQIPVGAQFCDHVEETVFPVQAWDTEYVAAKFQSRGIEPDIWRVVASQDNTQILTDPPQFEEDVVTLNRGEYFEFFTTEDFKLNADAPVLLVQYMTGSSTTNSADDGDPSMLTTVPVRQYRRDYVFLVPDTYERDWVTIVFPEEAAPELDGEAVDLDEAVDVGATGFKIIRLPVEDGRHVVESNLPVGVSVYGYDRNISYAYPAGLNLSAEGE